MPYFTSTTASNPPVPLNIGLLELVSVSIFLELVKILMNSGLLVCIRFQLFHLLPTLTHIAGSMMIDIVHIIYCDFMMFKNIYRLKYNNQLPHSWMGSMGFYFLSGDHRNMKPDRSNPTTKVIIQFQAVSVAKWNTVRFGSVFCMAISQKYFSIRRIRSPPASDRQRHKIDTAMHIHIDIIEYFRLFPWFLCVS